MRRAVVPLAVLLAAMAMVVAADRAIAVMFDGWGGLTETPRLQFDQPPPDPIPGGPPVDVRPSGGGR